MKFLRGKGGNMDSAYQYIQAVQQFAGAWVEELFQRARHPLESGKERRFIWPLAEVTAPHEELNKKASLAVRISTATWKAHMLFDQALRNYTSDFNNLYDKTAHVVSRNAIFEQHRSMEFDPSFVNAFMAMNKILTKMIVGTTEESAAYFTEKSGQLFTLGLSGNLEAIAQFWERQVAILDIVVHQNPAAMEAIRSEMGCRFDDQERYVKIAETPRAVLYQVLPVKKRVAVRKNGKPVIHKAPFILPESIIDLLPYEGLSYVGAFANSGTPTYFMHGKNIWDTAEAQVLSEALPNYNWVGM
jgi:hypothetical protein